MNFCTKFHGNPSNVETFHPKPKMSLWRKSQGLTKVTRVHHPGTMNVMNAIPSIGCWDISQDKWKLWPASVAIEEVRKSPKLSEFLLWGPWIFEQNFVVTHPVIFVIFHLKTKMPTSYWGKFRGSPKSVWFIIWGPWMSGLIIFIVTLYNSCWDI